MKLLLSCSVIFALVSKILCKPSYIVDIVDVQALEGDAETLVDVSDIKLVRRDRAMNGTIIIVEDMDNEAFKMSIEGLWSSSGNRNFRKVGIDVSKTDACEAFRIYYRQFLQPSLIAGENTDLPIIPEEGLCPFPKGTYYVKEMLFNPEKWPSQLPFGTVKAIIKFHKNDAFVGGLNLFVRIQSR